jgi:hypothetical protein
MNQFRKVTFFLVVLLAFNAVIPSLCLCQRADPDRGTSQYASADDCCADDAPHCSSIRNCAMFSAQSPVQALVVKVIDGRSSLRAKRSNLGDRHAPSGLAMTGSALLPLSRPSLVNVSPKNFSIFQQLFLKYAILRI